MCCCEHIRLSAVPFPGSALSVFLRGPKILVFNAHSCLHTRWPCVSLERIVVVFAFYPGIHFAPFFGIPYGGGIGWKDCDWYVRFCAIGRYLGILRPILCIWLIWRSRFSCIIISTLPSCIPVFWLPPASGVSFIFWCCYDSITIIFVVNAMWYMGFLYCSNIYLISL